MAPKKGTTSSHGPSKQRKKTAQLIQHFTSPANKAWFDKRKNQKIIVEKTIAAPVQALLDIRGTFARLDWQAILELKGDYYPSLVQEFYANIIDKDSPTPQEICSQVKGIEIKITREFLTELLDIPDFDGDFDFGSGRVSGDTQFNRDGAIASLGIRPHKSQRQRDILWTKDLSILDRLVVYMISFNVLLKASGLNEIRFIDLYLLERMHDLRPLDGIALGPVLMWQMMQVVRPNGGFWSFCFPLLLTKIFEAHGVSFAGEDKCSTGSTDILSESTMRDFKYVNKEGRWQKQSANDSSEEEDGTNDNAAAEAEGDSGHPLMTLEDL